LTGLVCADVREALAAFELKGAFAFPQEVNVVLADARASAAEMAAQAS
jgi:hypothetical protein